jgi:hypothetical protein
MTERKSKWERERASERDARERYVQEIKRKRAGKKERDITGKRWWAIEKDMAATAIFSKKKKDNNKCGGR